MLKQKAGKRFLPWLLAIAMLCSLLPVGALAEPPTEDSGTPDVAFRCLDSEGSADVSVGDYDSSTTAETLFADTSSDVISLTADSPEDSLKEGVIEDTDISVQFDKAVVLENGDIPETQEALEEEGTEISAVIKTDNDFACLPAEGGKPVNLGEDQTLVIIYKEEEATSDADANNEEEETEDEANANDIATLLSGAAFGIVPFAGNSGSYPVYVYGRFMNGDEPLKHGTKIVKNDVEKDIIWNGTTSNYITFGKIGAVSPLADPNAKAESIDGNAATATAKLKDMAPYAKGDKNFTTDDVTTWDLHTSAGATNYDITSGKHKWAWHLDGDIHVYQIAYDPNDGIYKNSTRITNDGKYYFGSYKVSDSVPTREGYTFKGWTIEGDTSGKVYAKANIIPSLKAVGGTDATITLEAKWEKDSYPVYVYGYLVNGSGNAGASLGNGAKIIKDNGTPKDFSSNGYANYITFGKVDNAVEDNPVGGTETTISSTDAAWKDWNEKLTVITATTDLQHNGFTWKDVSTWLLKPADGATDYAIGTAVKTWHLDGKINVYKIKYLDDVNGKDISTECGITPNAYYCGTYNVSNYAPSLEGYTFEGWTLNGKTYKAGDTLTLADFGDAETITLTAKWKKINNPVYVYGYFKHNGTQLTGADITVNGKGIEWNEDSAISEYFITFGKITNGTSEIPTTENATTDSFDENNLKELNNAANLFTGIGNAGKNNIKWTDVNAWDALKTRKGAASYNEAEGISEKMTWHLDGAINVYTVAYNAGGENVTNLPTANGYYFGSYTVAKQEPSRAGYTFTGWTLDGNKVGNTISLNKDTELVAQWKRNTVAVTFKIEGGTWDGNNKTDKIEIVTPPYELNATSSIIPHGMKHDADHTADGAWYDANGNKVIWKNETITENTTYTYRFEEIKYNEKAIVTFKVVNGTWSDHTTDDKVVTIALTKGMGTLNQDDVPANMIADANYGNGKWDAEPNTAENAVTEDVTYTYTFERAAKSYTVVYDWGNEAPSDKVLPVDNTSYPHHTHAVAAKDTTHTAGSTSNAPKGDVEGTWTFSGWTHAIDHEKAIVTFSGNWTFEAAKEPVKTLKLTFMVEGGTWNDATSDPIAISECVPGEDGYCSMPNGTAVPRGMVADKNHIQDSGKWYRLDGEDEVLVENIEAEKFNVDTTYIFIFAAKPEIQPDKITDTLNKLIQKAFESRYGYSTEGTFTAKATVMLNLSIPMAADDEYEPEVIGIYNGTVTLKTGETKAFSFTAADANQPDTLEANTTYVVKVTEDNTNLSNVDYDKTEYTLTFTTDENGVAGDIAITPNNGDETTDKITFHNIYTYKRHSSNNGSQSSTSNTPPTVEITDDEALGLNNTDHFAYIVGYGNGEVRPQNSITRAEVAAIFFRLLEDDVRDENYTRQNKFTDVSNDAWYCSAVSTLSAMGIISGYPDATFRPNASITRAEFAAIATRFDVDGDKTPVSFSDIAGHWAKDEIAVAANNGWVNGYEDGSFRPQNNITRAETMSLVNRVLNRKPETPEDLLSNMTTWTDNADTNAWYYLAVQEATNSHYYEFKENSQYEKWTELRETRDWSELDK